MKSSFHVCSNSLPLTFIHFLLIFQIHFGESSMQRCEIMLNDLIDSKRTNHNIKATIKSTQTGNFMEC